MTLALILTLVTAVPLTVRAVQIETPMTFSTGLHTAAIKTDGSLWMWGLNNYGQLGNGATKTGRIPEKIGDGYASVSVGAYHTLAVKTDGTLWAWGRNNYGQLGDGTTIDRSVPVKIMNDVRTADSKESFSFAVKTDGTLWAWGENSSYTIGDGSDINNPTPVFVMDDVSAISAGNSFALALRTDGSLWSWGHNKHGQLGYRTSGDYGITPQKVMDNVSLIDTAAGCSLAVDQNGQLWSGGWNYHGQAGRSSTPYAVDFAIRGFDNIHAISGGADFGAAIKTDGTLWTWGRNEENQRGLNKDSVRDGVFGLAMTDAIALDCGFRNVVALKPDGSLWGWGENDYSQLGNGTQANAEKPIKILDDILIPGAAPSGSVTHITLSESALTLTVGQTKKLTAQVRPGGADPTVRWISTNPAVATVSNDSMTASGGTIEALSEGQTVISALTPDGQAAQNCVVTVVAAAQTDESADSPEPSAIDTGYAKPVDNYPNTPLEIYPNPYLGWLGVPERGAFAGRFHLGIDILHYENSPVYAVRGGKVVCAQLVGEYGNLGKSPGGVVIIEHTNDDGKPFYALYGHIKIGDGIAEGKTVAKGDPIGAVALWDPNSPYQHLHFGINTRALSYTGYTSNSANTLGFVDPIVFLDTTCGGLIVKAPAEQPAPWAKADIDAATALGLATPELCNGYTTPTTRIEFCRGVVNMLRVVGYPADSVTPKTFADTTDRDIGIAASLGIITGSDTANNLFNPDGTLTREQAATMLRNVWSVVGFYTEPKEAVAWTDRGDIASWAQSAVDFITGQGIMGSTESGKLTFSPKTLYTHQQSIITLLRVYQALTAAG
jgi:alpha-tubulin suppressor-like RCC1 family protein